MRLRVLLTALGVFTLVNGAITFYLVHTMYGDERQREQRAADDMHEQGPPAEMPVLDARPPPPPPPVPPPLAPQALPPLPSPLAPRRCRLRCLSYKKHPPRARGLGECYGDRGTPYVQKALGGYFEMTQGDDWDLLWTLVPQARYDLARYRPELFVPEASRSLSLSPPPLRLWCDDQVDSIMFLAGAGDKCRLAEYLAAVHEAHTLHSFIGGTQLLSVKLQEPARSSGLAEFQRAMIASGVTRWIFKPCSGGGGDGQGIVTVDDLSALPDAGTGVAQPYVINPYLFQGVKFHLRLYALVTSYGPVRALLFKEGLLKRAGSKYVEVDDAVLTEMQRSGGDAADEIRKAHWTNQHVNKDTPPLPLSEFFAAVDADAGDHGLGGTAREIWRQMRVRSNATPAAAAQSPLRIGLRPWLFACMSACLCRAICLRFCAHG